MWVVRLLTIFASLVMASIDNVTKPLLFNRCKTSACVLTGTLLGAGVSQLAQMAIQVQAAQATLDTRLASSMQREGRPDGDRKNPPQPAKPCACADEIASLHKMFERLQFSHRNATSSSGSWTAFELAHARSRLEDLHELKAETAVDQPDDTNSRTASFSGSDTDMVDTRRHKQTGWEHVGLSASLFTCVLPSLTLPPP